MGDQHRTVYQIVINKHDVWVSSKDFKEEHLQTDLPRNEEDAGYFPVDGRNVCPYLGIRKIPYKVKHHRVPNPNQVCKLRVTPKEECKKAYGFYRVGTKPPSCNEKGSTSDLCTVVQEFSSHVQVKCDLSPCGRNPVYVASIDRVNGELENKKKWKKFVQVKDLERNLPRIITENTQNGFHFCFIQCRSGARNTDVQTILSFPPQATRTEKKFKGLFNVNVVVLDSVSRAQFYRSLPKTVATLRHIEYNNSLNLRVLDYELMQSLGAYTFVNIKAFFTGNSMYHTEQKNPRISQNQYYYGFDLFYNRLKEKGFRTIFQEDSCWYDVWGTLLANTKKKMVKVKSPEEKETRWKEFLEEIRRSKIDDTGITDAACTVFKQYNLTNQFNNEPKQVCYGSKTFTQYFLDYLEKTFSQSAVTDNAVPIFAYSHFAVGHEVTGTRIQQIDEGLSTYLSKAAEDQNTLTILFSDHGPKTTKYFIHSIEGMYELYSPFMFIILPNKIAKIIGEKRVKNLINNQKRLVTLKDVNGALSASILANDSSKKVKEPSWREGLFSEKKTTRSCAGMHNVLCVCDGFETWYPDNQPNFTWIAEFAVGEINNEIQRLYTEHMRGQMTSSTQGGFGKCQKLVGINFRKIHQTEDAKNYFVTMQITTNPLLEVFEVMVKFPKTPPSLKRKFKIERKLLRLLSHRRLTTYQNFFDCKDNDVSIHLCVCKRRKYNDYKKWTWVLMNSPKAVHEVMRRHSNFGANQEIQNLDSDCLYFVTRSHHNRQSLAYDIVNACEGRRYKVHIAGRSVSKVITSISLPFQVESQPLTIKMVLIVHHFRKPLDFRPLISYKIISS
ncbi:hypothetical protein QZH41_015513 [Actinostola sp. cb2023]|nr:hypothetical protein QZH41_015513 [Actinostola sp. cb2023]